MVRLRPLFSYAFWFYILCFGLWIGVSSTSAIPASAQTTSEKPGEMTQAPVALKTALSLSEALRLADEHNLQIQIARKNLDVSEFDIRIAKRFPNPQFTGAYTAGRLYNQLSYPQQFGVNQLIETAGKRRKRTDVAQARHQLTDLQYNALRWDIRSQTRQAYAGLLAAEQNAVLIDTQALLLDRLAEIARRRVKAGAAPMAELYQAQLARNQLNTQKNEAAGQIEKAEAQLNGLLDISSPSQFEITDTGLFQVRAVKTEIAPPPSMTLPPKDPLYEQALQGRADLKILRQEQVVAQDQLKLTKAQRIPDLLLLAGYQYAITPASFYGSRFFGGPNIGTTVELPILHNQGAEIAKIRTVLNQNELRIQDLQHQIRIELDKAYADLKTSHENIRFFRTVLIPEAQQVLSLAERSYQIGKTPLANVIIAQQSFQQIISSYTQTVINYQNAWGELEKAVGSPMSAW